MKLTITQNTLLKAQPVQSADLSQAAPDQMVPVNAGDVFQIEDHYPYEGGAGVNDDHWFVQLSEPPDGYRAIRWFVYGHHCQVEGTEPINNPQDEPAPDPPIRDRGRLITLPGISGQRGIYDSIYAGSNFTWGEATKGGQRIPASASVTTRIVKLAKYMDDVREHLGNNPIIVTSWYRDPVTNRRVGGASRSRHLSGDAIDFRVRGQSVVDTFKRLKGYHTTGGLAVGNGFVHLDLRPGGAARWHYPGGPQVALW